MSTPKQQQVLSALIETGNAQTVRALADIMESTYHRAERWSDDEVRGHLEYLERDGYVVQYRGDKGEALYRPAKAEQ